MKQLFAFSLIFIVAVVVLFGAGCANIIPPSGGPRDTLPPTLLSATPGDSTTNFKDNNILLTFDEYVDLQDIQNNLLFTPTFQNVPLIEARGKTLTIRFRDTLQPNTTYTLNFGNAIRDINESNVLRNFVYTFSTGPFIDSLELSGKVVLAETGKTDSTLMVLLHRNLSDSAVRKLRPTYITRLDANGNFRLKNLPEGKFAIYALGEAGLMRTYNRGSQLFAFLDSTVQAGQSQPVTLYAYRETPATSVTNVGAIGVIQKATDKRLQFTTNLTGGQQDLFKDLTLTFGTPLKIFDSAMVQLAKDSVFSQVPFTTTLDSSKKQLTLQTQWQEGTPYHLILSKDFAEDSLGRKLLKSDTLHFSTKKNTDYGNVTVRVKNVDAIRNPVLQFVQNDQVVFSAPLRSGVFSQTLFTAGEYQLRILYDTNGNLKWDAGNFSAKKLPEIVRPITGRTITVKPNWDNEFDVSL